MPNIVHLISSGTLLIEYFFELGVQRIKIDELSVEDVDQLIQHSDCLFGCFEFEMDVGQKLQCLLG